jgi:3-oxoacyl-[acyl-carrier protein] reductase
LLQHGPGVAVVTGGSRGIGRQLTRYLASQGWRTAICATDFDRVQNTASSISKEFGVECIAKAADVRDSASLKEFAALVLQELGAPTALICNAAILGPIGRFEDCSEDEWNQAIAINLLGVANSIRVFLPEIEKSPQGRIVVMSGGGVGGPSPLTRSSAYTTSKSALGGLVESIANDLLDSSTTINLVAPGSVATGFMRGVLDAGKFRAGTELFDDAQRRDDDPSDEIPIGLVELLEFLLSTNSSHVRGRLLSARWETPRQLGPNSPVSYDPDLFKMRRIDDQLFASKRSLDQ